jgi:transposase-like protein
MVSGSKEGRLSMPQESGNGPVEAPRPERWSAQQKTDVVLRLLRGEDLGEVSREIQVPAHELEEWRRVFLDGGTQGLKRRSGDPAEKELTRTRAKLGETMMNLELVEGLLEKRGYGDELRKLLKSGRG